MDVRCERCRTQYVFGDEQVGPDGLPVRCSNCGHVFLVKKKELVVTVPVKPGELREAPVSTADLNVAAGAGAAGPTRGAPGRGARPSREDPDKARPWNLRNRRGELYPFRDLSTLQKWIVERKASRDDEVSHQDGPWRRLGDMLELEPFFTLVERAERSAAPSAQAAPKQGAAEGGEQRPAASQPTLVDFPPPRGVFPGPGHQPAPQKTGRFPALAEEEAKAGPGPDASASEPGAVLERTAAAVSDEGPVRGKIGPVAEREPAWTSQPARPVVERYARARPAAGRSGKRSRVGLIVLVAALAACAAAVYLTNPEWLGLRPLVGQPPGPEIGAGGSDLGASGSTAPLGAPAHPGTPGLPGPHTPASPAVPPVAGAPAPAPGATSTAPPSAASAGTSGTSAATGQPPQAHAGGSPAGTEPPKTAPPASSAGTEQARPPSSPAASAPTPAPDREGAATAGASSAGTSHGTAPSTTARPTEGKSAGASKPAVGASPAGGEEEGKAEGTPPPAAREPAKPVEQVKVAPKRSHAAAAAEPQKPAARLKRLIAEARRLRARGKPEAALRAYGQAVELEPRNADALAGRGLCYLDLSQYEPAEASFHAALEADARHAEALMGLAETYRYEGRRTDAVTYYHRYLAAHPDGEDAVAARSAIEALKE
jgi:predicted Zn finger-like uncharacterized protein